MNEVDLLIIRYVYFVCDINMYFSNIKGMAQQDIGNVKQTFAYPGKAAQEKSKKSKWVQGEGDP